MPDQSGIDWDQVHREQGSRKREYASRTCPLCGKTITEGAWGSKDSNWKRHSQACEAKHKKPQQSS